MSNVVYCTCASSPLVPPYMRVIFGVNLAVFGGADILATISLNGDLKQKDAFKTRSLLKYYLNINSFDLHLLLSGKTGMRDTYS